MAKFYLFFFKALFTYFYFLGSYLFLLFLNVCYVNYFIFPLFLFASDSNQVFSLWIISCFTYLNLYIMLFSLTLLILVFESQCVSGWNCSVYANKYSNSNIKLVIFKFKLIKLNNNITLKYSRCYITWIHAQKR